MSQTCLTPQKKALSFEMIYDTYIFDKRLSSILIDLFESVEVTFKTQLAYYLAHEKGPIGYLDATNFHNQSHHANFLSEYNRSIPKSVKLFIEDKQLGIGFPTNWKTLLIKK